MIAIELGPASRMGDEEDPRSDFSDNEPLGKRKDARCKGKSKGKGKALGETEVVEFCQCELCEGKGKGKAVDVSGYVEVGGKSAKGKT